MLGAGNSVQNLRPVGARPQARLDAGTDPEWVASGSWSTPRSPTAWWGEALRARGLAEFEGHTEVAPEQRYGESRIDFRLEGERGVCWVEVKNVTLAEGGVGRFPDAVSQRATKHLRELEAVIRGGERAVLFFHVGRSDVGVVRPADDVDPEYGQALRRAVAAGVEVVAYRSKLSKTGVTLDTTERVPVEVG